MSIITALLLAYAFERAHMIIAAPNYGSAYNGLGAIELTARRANKAPMAYRVLMPWLVVGTEKLLRAPLTRRLDIYQAWKVVLTGLAFWAVALAWSVPVALATAVLMLLLIQYDYWSYAPELAGIALAMTGVPGLAIPGAILFGLSRETAPITGLLYYLVTGDVWGTAGVTAAAVGTLALVRMRVGKRESYTGLFKLLENGRRLVKRDPQTGKLILFLYQPLIYSSDFISLLVTAAALAAVVSGAPGGAGVLVLLAACWGMALSDETRVFTPVMPWIAALILGGAQ